MTMNTSGFRAPHLGYRRPPTKSMPASMSAKAVQVELVKIPANPVAHQNLSLLSEQRPRLEAMKKNCWRVITGEVFMDRQVHWGPTGEKGVFHTGTNDFLPLDEATKAKIAIWKMQKAGKFDPEKAQAKAVITAPGHKTNVGNPNPKGTGGSKDKQCTNSKKLARLQRKAACRK